MTKNLLSRSDRFHPGPAPTVSADPNRQVPVTCFQVSLKLIDGDEVGNEPLHGLLFTTNMLELLTAPAPLRTFLPCLSVKTWSSSTGTMRPLAKAAELSCPILPAMP